MTSGGGFDYDSTDLAAAKHRIQVYFWDLTSLGNCFWGND